MEKRRLTGRYPTPSAFSKDASPFAPSVSVPAAAPHENHDSEKSGQKPANQSHGCGIHCVSPSLYLSAHLHMFSIMGIKSRTSLVITGPIVTTKSEGSTQKKIGNTSLTASFEALSSAFCLAMMRR